ncbi:hypothetical protein [uncultured Megamonas sp.]|uniref:hypothetical protein n=1 Tax=uncultured Megamonas sp. TaxID=286140 RepID=UPI0025D3064C|nr:hypothetical protein [uncultured Megamonas sp.]
MKNIIKIFVFCMLLSFVPSITMAQVSSEYMGDTNQTYSLAYPVVSIDDEKSENKINKDIEIQLDDLKEKIEKHVYSKVDMTYYEKYEDDNIISLMFYVNKKKKFSNLMELTGYTVTYDKHTGERVPMDRYLNINLEQLQDALNNSYAYTVDGLDNGVNLSKRIPYVSHNYFICHDGSIGLLYQPGDLMEVEAGACKIIVSPETIAKVNELNKASK